MIYNKILKCRSSKIFLKPENTVFFFKLNCVYLRWFRGLHGGTLSIFLFATSAFSDVSFY